MTVILKQSTATTIKFGPIVDVADATVETGLTLTKSDVRLSKNGGNMAAANADQGVADAGAPHDELGMYDISLDTTDTNTLGVLDVVIGESGTQVIKQTYHVVPANVFDSGFSTDKLQVHVTEMDAGVITSTVLADNAITAAKINADAITNAKIADGAIAAEQFAADAITAAKLASDVTTELQNGLATAAALTTVGNNVTTLLAADAAYKRAVAVTAFAFYMELTDGSPGTGLTVTATISKDGGAFAGVAGAVTEISAGWYEHDLTGTEMTADEIALKYTATGTKQRNIKIRTQS
jgi:hypothetical protein